MSTPPVPMSPDAAIAVLFERLGNLISAVDALAAKIDAQDQKRTKALDELEQRVEHIERQVNGVRWFLAGVAAAGGGLGGLLSAGLLRMFGT